MKVKFSNKEPWKKKTDKKIVTPCKYPNSVFVIADTATFPLPLDNNALFAVKSVKAIVVEAPVNVDCLPVNCVLIFDIEVSICVILGAVILPTICAVE